MKKKLKVVAMIPARLGSKRVPKKNLRLLGNKPLISYVVETAIKSDVFDEVYINSEAKVFSAIADELGASFYQRSEALASDETNNDQFLLDFCEHVDADIVVQILPTSPFLTVDEVRSFVNKMLGKSLDTLVSTVDHQIACVFKDSPVNFSKIEPHISSQNMVPVSSYATVLMAWRREFFLDAMAKYGFGYHGADGKTDYFSLEGFSTVDIDNEHDFLFAEAVYEYLSKPLSRLSEPRYYTGHAHAEFDVPSILKIDGIDYFDFKNENCPLSNIKSIISSMDNSRSWCYRVVNSESNSATLISQLPGEGNRRHYHPDWNEWWYIIAGCWQWDVENESFVVNSGDIVFIEKGKWHKITALGDVPAIRLAVSRADVLHVYE
jgi:CMP-N-acetylneuraminic acid synthetase/mannose-6-phosphate isomerase-like protein (cupin superfamily)